MTLAFSTAINGKITHFPEKILNGLVYNELIKISAYRDCVNAYLSKAIVIRFDVPNKIHTIRRDEKNKWKTGNKIHFVIHNRTPQRYQFAPVIPCVSKQRVIIHYWYNPKTENFDDPAVYVDGKEMIGFDLLTLAINDGFDSIEDFFQYFNQNWAGWLIHWTNKKY